jgi:hypothetical protein
MTHGALIQLYGLFPHHLSVTGPVVLIPLLGITVGMVAEFVWKQGKLGKLILATVVIFNACYGLFVVIAADILIGAPYARCE